MTCSQGKMSTRLKAFSLLEVSLALGVMGVMALLLVPFIENMLLLKNHEVTKTRMERILYALSAHVLSEKRLPCPTGSLTDGKELVSCDDAFKGYVPYQSLGLMEKDVCDAKGNPFVYGVNPELTVKKEALMVAPDLDPLFVAVKEQFWCDTIGSRLVVEGLDVPDFDTLAVVLLSTSKQEEVKSMAFKKEAPKQELLYVTRNSLMSSYAHRPCFHLDETSP
jgi:hypothetical protein